ncbi:MAG: hypothetical protein P8101_21795, partial [Candidatus Thiodiazotropha sp.]
EGASPDLAPVTLPMDGATGPEVDGTLSESYANYRLRFEQGLVDYREKIIDREALESLRLSLRQAQAAMDEQFRQTAEMLKSGLAYQPLGGQLEVFILRNDATSQPVAIWLRHPEDLQPRFAATQFDRFVGRTSITIDHGGEVFHRKIALSDGTQIILFPAEGATWQPGNYTLTLHFKRDHGDEASDYDHRYDRPIIYPNGSGPDNTIVVALQL